MDAGRDSAAGGWYSDPDPEAPVGRLRWWDGAAWTAHLHEPAAAAAPAAAPVHVAPVPTPRPAPTDPSVQPAARTLQSAPEPTATAPAPAPAPAPELTAPAPAQAPAVEAHTTPPHDAALTGTPVASPASPQTAPYIPAAPTRTPHPGRAATLLIWAGVGFLLAGLSRLIGALILDELELQGVVIAVSVLEGLSLAGAFAALGLAGFPTRTTLGRVVTWVLVGLYTFLGLAGYALGSVAPIVPALLGYAVLGAGITFAILAGRNPAIPASLRYLPFVLYGGLIMAVVAPFVIALLLGAVVLITVAVLTLAFAPRAAAIPA